MTRGPRALRAEVQQVRRSDSAQLGKLSECLREAGSEVIAKSQGQLVKTDISRAGLMGEGPDKSEIRLLRAELEEKKQGIQALQRNYAHISSMAARDSEELAELRKFQMDAHQEMHGLQRENDRMKKELQTLRDQEQALHGGQKDLQQQFEKKAAAAEQKIADFQAAAKAAKEQVARLQESLQTEKSRSQAAGRQLREAQLAADSSKKELEEARSSADAKDRLLKESQSELSKQKQQCAAHERSLQAQEKKLREAEQQRSSQGAESSSLQARMKSTLEKVGAQGKELEEQGKEVLRLSGEVHEQARLASAAEQRALAAETQIAALAQQRTDEVEALRDACEKERQCAAALRGELARERQACKAAATGQSASDHQIRELSSRLQGLGQELAAARKEVDMQKGEIAQWSGKATRLATDHDAACEELRQAHAGGESAQQQLGQLRSNAQKLQSDLASKQQALSELESQKLRLERELQLERDSARALQERLGNTEAAHGQDAAGLREELEGQGKEVLRLNGEVQEQARLANAAERRALAAEAQVSALAQQHADEAEELSKMREATEALSAERDALRESMTQAIRRSGALEQECHTLRSSAAAAGRAEEAAARRAEEAERQQGANSDQLRAQIDSLSSELAASRQQVKDISEEAARWGEKAAQLETNHGTACARLRRAEANLEILQNQLDESQTEVEQLRTELDVKEKRLAVLKGR